MMKELDKIKIHGMRFYGYHGIHPEEKKLGQWFELDVEIWGDLKRACLSDDLADTINYSEIYNIVKKIVEGRSINLLEHLSQRIAEQLLLLPLVNKVMVRAKKPDAPLGGSVTYASVEIIRCKNEE